MNFKVDVNLDVNTNMKFAVTCQTCGAKMPARLTPDQLSPNFVLAVPGESVQVSDWAQALKFLHLMSERLHTDCKGKRN